MCFVEDPATKRQHPRNYLEQLEQRVLLLESQLRDANSYTPCTSSSSQNDRLATHYEQSSAVEEDGNELGDLSSMIGTLSLNAAGAEPSYLGPSSTFAFSRFVRPSLRQALGSLPANLSVPVADRQDSMAPEPCALPDYQTAIKLSNAYFQNIHAQYPFLHEPTFREWEASLADPFDVLSSLNYNPVPIYFLNIVL